MSNDESDTENPISDSDKLIEGKEYYIEEMFTRGREDRKIYGSGRAQGTFVREDCGKLLRDCRRETSYLIFKDLKSVKDTKKHGLDGFLNADDGYYHFPSNLLIVKEKRFTDKYKETANQAIICAELVGAHTGNKKSTISRIIMSALGYSSEMYDRDNSENNNPEKMELLEKKLKDINEKCLILSEARKATEEKDKGKGKSRKIKRVKKLRRKISVKNNRKSRRRISIKNNRKSHHK